MKKVFALLNLALIITLTANGQNFFFLGENSYPCTETITLQSNYDSRSNLDVTFAKDGSTGLIIVSTKAASTLMIDENLIIYLDDGTVISCIDRGIKDQVDFISSTVYYLTEEEIGKLKNSNINSIKYTLKSKTDITVNMIGGGNYSASNKESSRTDFPAMIAGFFNQ